MFDLISVIKGIYYMNNLTELFKRWQIRFHKPFSERNFWFHCWTPIWHEGRGFYLSIGLKYITIYRGY